LSLSVRLVESPPNLISVTGVLTGTGDLGLALASPAAIEREGEGGASSGTGGGGWNPPAPFAPANGVGARTPPAASPGGKEGGVLATFGVDGSEGGCGAGWTCSGCGVARACGIARLDSIGPGSGGSPCLRNPSPGCAGFFPLTPEDEVAELEGAPGFSLAALLEADFTEGVTGAEEVIRANEGCGAAAAGAGSLPPGSIAAETPSDDVGVLPAGSGWVLPGSFAEEAGGGSGAADAEENPARSCSSV
jgi:hypothetical protein